MSMTEEQLSALRAEIARLQSTIEQQNQLLAVLAERGEENAARAWVNETFSRAFFTTCTPAEVTRKTTKQYRRALRSLNVETLPQGFGDRLHRLSRKFLEELGQGAVDDQSN